MASFNSLKPKWALNSSHEKSSLPQLEEFIDMKGDSVSVGKYFTEMLDPL